MTERRCKDDGVCHHSCAVGECFRQDCCVPLTCSGLDDQWRTPAEAMRYTTAVDGSGKIVQLAFTSRAYDKIIAAVQSMQFMQIIEDQAAKARAFKLRRLSLRSRR